MASSNPCDGPSPRTKISFFVLLLKSADKFILAPKITTFLPQLPSAHKNCERASNPIP